MINKLNEIRQKLHRIPEIAFKEYETKELLLHLLSEVEGIIIHQFSESPGILVEYSHGKGEYLLFRADMDALPIEEATKCLFKSKHSGMMHACGHDVHMTILMGLIYEITSAKNQRNLLFLFQPAEEGQGGAESVIKENMIQKFKVKHAFALHVSGNLSVNTVSAKAGVFFAIPQEFNLEFLGRSAHVAFPEKGNNALKGGMAFSAAMDKYIEQLEKSEQVIFNIGVMNSGTIRNVIPDRCIFQGTHRSLSVKVRNLINSEIKSIAESVATKYDLQYKLDLLCSYDPVINDETLLNTLKLVCSKTEVEFVESITYMTGEDFGYFTTMYPSLLFWLGAGKDSGDLHSNTFLPDEKCIPIGIKVFKAIIDTIE
jgi:N-acetyldiaminopimelate deacetylase